jgi:hypothetical protein
VLRGAALALKISSTLPVKNWVTVASSLPSRSLFWSGSGTARGKN